MAVARVLRVWCLLTFLWTSAALATPPLSYTVTILGPAARGAALAHPGGEGALQAEGLDVDGSVAVTVTTGALTTAGILAPGGGLTLLGTLTPGWSSVAHGVDGGTVVGYSYTAGGVNHAFQWTASTGLVDINHGLLLSVAWGVRGPLIAGFCVVTAGTMQPCLWREGLPYAFSPAGGTGRGEVFGVTSAGAVVGSYLTLANVTHAVLLDADGTVHDLHPPGATASRAVAITEARVVIGVAFFASNPSSKVFRWDQTSGITFLTPLPGFAEIDAHDLTDELLLGTVYDNYGRPQRGIRWTSPTTPEDLSTLLTEAGWVIYDTVQGNEAGQILAYGTKDGAADYAVLLTPVPPAPPCPLDQGFWKTHPGVWPITSLTLGSQFYTQAALLALFNTPPRGDASVILAHQLIAAKLNIANGSNPTPVSATITDADSLLSQFGSNRLPYNVRTSSAIGRQMVNDANVLDRYNNGDLTPDCQP